MPGLPAEILRRLTRRSHPPAPVPTPTERVVVGGLEVTVRYLRHPRARRYRLAWLGDGTARCTVPPRGSWDEARRFVARCHDWLAIRAARHDPQGNPRGPLPAGARTWFRGREIPVVPAAPGPGLDLDGEILPLRIPPDPSDLRPALSLALRRLAESELPPRVRMYADLHGFTVRRITIRDQRSRWGSCSPRATLSLNWRLVQVPDPVRDYIVLHELAHLRHLNHSPRFWAEVERICPGYAEAEAWIRRHGREIL